MQRLAHADIALIGHVEIARAVAGEIGGAILDDGFLRDQPLFEGKAVDERLQRRTRRAADARHVDPAGAAAVEIIRRADFAEDFAGAGIGHYHGDGDFRTQPFGRLAGDGLKAVLHRAVERGLVLDRLRVLAQRQFRKVGGIGGKLAAAVRHGFKAGALGLALADDIRDGKAGQHALARLFGDVAVAVRAALFGKLRQGDEQGGFGDREPLRLLAEPGKACGPHALQIAAIGGERQVEIEDFSLGKPAFELDGAGHLAQLRKHRAAFARLDQPGDLHGERGGARDDAAIADELAGGAQKRPGVDTAVLVEASVLIGHQHAQELRIDIGGRGLQPPVSLWCREGTQQAAVAVEHFLGDGFRHRNRRRKGTVGVIEPEGEGGNRCRPAKGPNQKSAPQRHRQTPYSALTTCMRPVAVRAEYCGRYMSSTWAAGRS